MVEIKNNLPPYEEQITVSQEVEQIQQILKQFKQLVPEGFKKLEPAKKNNWGSTEGLDKTLCERYLFVRENNKPIWLDITHELMEKLELPFGKPCPWPFYLDPKVLEKEEVEGAITIEKEKEISLQKPFSIQNLSQNLTKLFQQIEALEKEKEQNQTTITELTIEWDNLVNRIDQLETLLFEERGSLQTEIAKLKDWKNQFKFELVPRFWPGAVYTEDTPSVEVLVEEVKKLLLVKEQIENEKDNYRDKYDGAEEELSEKREIINALGREKERELNQKDSEITRLNNLINNFQNLLGIDDLNNLPTLLGGENLNSLLGRPTHTQLNNLRREKDQELTTKNTQIANLTNQFNGLQTNYNNLNNELTTTRRELDKEKDWWDKWINDNSYWISFAKYYLYRHSSEKDTYFDEDVFCKIRFLNNHGARRYTDEDDGNRGLKEDIKKYIYQYYRDQ